MRWRFDIKKDRSRVNEVKGAFVRRVARFRVWPIRTDRSSTSQEGEKKERKKPIRRASECNAMPHNN